MKLSPASSALFVLPCLSLVAIAAACSSSAEGGDGDVAQASAAITQVPPQVACVEIVVVGSRPVDSKFSVASGQSSVVNLTTLPVGSVTFTAYAYASACSSVTTGASATWLSAPVAATLSAGTVTNVTLALVLNGTAAVGVNFENDGGAPLVDAGAIGVITEFPLPS